MKETVEQIAQRIQDARGYIVLASTKDLPIGHVSDKVFGGNPMSHFECKVVIIARTDYSDWKDQHDLSGFRLYGPHEDEPYYFRARAE